MSRYNDGEDVQRHDPRNFADAEWLFPDLAKNVDCFIDLYVKGTPRDVAVIRAFEMIKYGKHLGNADLLSQALLSVPVIATKVAERIKASKPDDLWHSRLAAHKLLQIVMDERNRESARLNAIGQLNLLLGITELTDAGQQKLIDKSLTDFYALRVERQYGTAPETNEATRH
ncbi:hypothetical protein AB3X96_18020 [Paraburkholderia sp. BR13439]|uniref:hypothetical protein n=1 Tax=Paraburkholderia sp. BR13439 TaxID=3236996 RepID=UPI0034CDC000